MNASSPRLRERSALTPNLIPPGCSTITPHMLPLVELDPSQIEGIANTVPGGARNIQDIYPLAPLQEGMLFQHLLEEKAGAYVAQTLLEMHSRAHLLEFISALQHVIDRYDVLRSAVLWEGLPRPVQVVYRHGALPVEEIALDVDRDPVELLRERMGPRQLKLDPRQAPLLRLQVVPDALQMRWYALLQMHHLICDAQSLQWIFSEVAARMQGRSWDQKEPVQYRDHVVRTVLNARRHDAEVFFARKLGDVDEPTAPFGVLDTHGDDSQREEAPRRLDSVLGQRIRMQARRYQVTVATLFHAAWALVVSRTGARDDVVYGTVLFGRLQMSRASQQSVGMFLNTLPLRLCLRQLTAKELVTQTQRELIELLAFEQTSLAVAQRCSGVSGSTPLFTTLLNYRYAARSTDAKLDNEATGIREIGHREAGTYYPITLSVDDLGEGFTLTLQTLGGIDPRRTVEYMAEAIQSLVEALERQPQTPALQLPVLPASERHQILETFNAAQAPYPRDKTVHQLFEEQVERTPGVLALSYEGQSLTYAQLNQRANQLARYLRDQGVDTEQRVGLFMERGLDAVVAVLGILKAGGAYVPLDPAHPAQRLAFMIEDSAPRLLLTQSSLLERVAALPVSRVALDKEWSEIAKRGDTNLPPQAPGPCSRHLIYVIYTSGSTGQPKGVMVEHGNVVNHWRALESLYRRPIDCRRVAVNAPFTFDASVQQWVQLLSGCTLFILPQSLRLDAQQLVRFLHEHDIDGIDSTPSQINNWIAAGLLESGRGASRTVLVGGEAIDSGLWKRMRQSENVVFYNVYGPTECTVDSTAADLGERVEMPHIGRPLHNTRVYILDARGEPVPIGVVGEIHIAGAGVARGYLNRAELTAERFLRDTLSADPWARMYKTGDLGKWHANGTIEYLGRNDHQVKIRGFRIELGEIETQLRQCPRVKEAVVIAREDSRGEKRLVAYLIPEEVPNTDVSLRAEILRERLKAVLPEYMVPSAFVSLERFPLTANGKLDRKALPAPDLSAYVSRDYEPPQGEVEEILAGIWQELLQVERVGRHNNFFELGGHSLLIVQMRERLRQVGLSTQVRTIFETPTLADLASALRRDATDPFIVPPNGIPPGCEAITPEMLSLTRLESEHIRLIEQAVPGGAANIQDIYPLAPLQEGILFHHQLGGQGGDTYVLANLLMTSSRGHLEVLIGALQATIDRHDVLRTAVLWERLPNPVQVVYKKAVLSVEELRLQPGEDPVEVLRERMRPARQRLDLRQAPLIRLEVVADPQGPQWYVLWQSHHMISDHLTAEVIFAEVLAQIGGRADSLPESLPYRNHVAQVLFQTRMHEAESFFRRKLGDVGEPTAPFGLLDARGDGSQAKEGRECLDSTLTQRIRVQARRLGVTAATIFHAAWGLAVSRISARDDVVYGTVLLGRLQGGANKQQALGLFMNTLPLRLVLRDLTAKQLVVRTQQELIELLTYEQISLAVAQRCSSISGSDPLFTSLLNYRHSARSSQDTWSHSAGVTFLGGQERSNYPLLISVDDWGNDFEITAQTDRRVDPDRVVAYLRTAVQSLVDALEQAPHVPAQGLPVLPEDERHQVIEQFNATQAPYPREKLVYQLFEEQVERAPDAIAVMYAGERLTYAQLNAKANQLARYLRAKGVGPDQRVAIALERSLQMVVGLLGILKAGSAYVPLDPNYPAERLEHMLTDASPRVVLTEASLLPALPGPQGEPIDLDAHWPDIARCAMHNLAAGDPERTAESLVYVIYTSGSTGIPKGTAMEHRSMVNLIEWHRREFGARGGQRVLQFAALSFDVAFQEIFSTLCTGNTLVLLNEGIRRDPRALTELLIDSGVNRLFMTPLMLQTLAEHLESAGTGPDALRDIIVAGEQLRVTPQITSLFRRMPGCRLHNHYGPTESHVVTALTLAGEPERWPELPGIGRPISNIRIYVLSLDREPVPVGVPGEIYIGGVGIARGYLNRPELTAERFVNDPFSADPRARMYKTGDLGRWRADGAIEYLGRNDHQVKIRGFRIELGEIEAQLTRLPQTKEAVVLAREDVPGEKRLVAYVIARKPAVAQGSLSAEDLRVQMKARLPEYMIPSAFVILTNFPLTPNGKLDRKALPPPDQSAYANGQYEAPRGEAQETLAAIWRQVLRVERVGRHDNFFELGGHSLLAMKLIAKVDEILHVRAPIITVFRCPTLEQLADQIESLRSADSKPSTAGTTEPALAPRLASERVPLTFSQRWMWNMMQQDPRTRGMGVLTSAVHLSGPLNMDILRQSFAALISRHEALRIRITNEDGTLRQSVVDAYEFALESVDLTWLPDGHRSSEARRLMELLAHARLSVTTGPLFTAKLLKMGDRDHLLGIAIHHLISDGASIGILLRDLFSLYTQFAQARSDSLPGIPVQYADYAVWQHKAQAFWLARHDGYWKERLSGASGLRAVKESPSRPTATKPVRVPFSFGEDLSAALRETSRRERTTPAMSVLTAYVAAIARFYRCNDLVVPFVNLGRPCSAVENTIGFFGVPLFLRIAVRAEDRLVDLLQRLMQEYSNAWEHHDSCRIAAQTPEPEFVSNPLFNWLPEELNMRPAGNIAISGGEELNVRPYEFEIVNRDAFFWEGEVRVDLSDTSLGIRGTLTYNVDRLSTDAVDSFKKHLHFFAEQLVKNPQASVGHP